jgi:hypothetical protein
MARTHLVEELQHLPFVGGHCVVRLDRGVRNECGRSGSSPLKRLLRRLIGAIERSARFPQSTHQCGP